MKTLQQPSPSPAKPGNQGNVPKKRGRKALPVEWRYRDHRDKPQIRRFADEAARDAEKQRLSDLGLLLGSAKAPTMAQAMEKHHLVHTFYQRAPGGAEKVKPYADAILLPRLGDRPIKSITTRELIDLRAEIMDERGKRSWDMVHIALNGAWKEAASRGWVSSGDNPLLRMPTYIPRYTTFINRQVAIQERLPMPTRAQLDILVAGAKGWARLAICIIILAGLRSQEMRALLWRHIRIDPINRLVHVKVERAAKFDGSIGEPKYEASSRTITCEGLLYDILAAAHPGEEQEQEFVIHQGRGMVTYSELHNAFLHIQLALGMGDQVRNHNDRLVTRGFFGLHQLRHGCVAIWIWDGILDGVIRYWIGHANISVTLDTYGYLFEAYEADEETWPVGSQPSVNDTIEEEEVS